MTERAFENKFPDYDGSSDVVLPDGEVWSRTPRGTSSSWRECWRRTLSSTPAGMTLRCTPAPQVREIHGRRRSAAYQSPQQAFSSVAVSAPMSPGISVESSLIWLTMVMNNSSASTALRFFPKKKN
ncbi:unnamed protein product [Ixodes pacificus]